MLEDTGLIAPVGLWVIDAACRQVAAWAHDGLGEIPVAVNLSSKQFNRTAAEERDGDTGGLLDFETQAHASVIAHGIRPQALEFELTESILMSNPAQTAAVLQRLRAAGNRISLDDFGTGYSSLAYLRHLPIDTLKVDRAFIRDIPAEAGDAAITAAIIEMAHALGMTVVAEGVETAAQAAFLGSRRCDEIQGYYMAKPVPGERFGDVLHAMRAAEVLKCA